MVKKILFGLTLGNGGPWKCNKSLVCGIRQVVQKKGPEKQSLPFWKVLLYPFKVPKSEVWDEISIRQK